MAQVMIILLCLLGAASTAFAAVSPMDSGSTSGYALPQPGTRFSFPRDHGSHPEFKIEWWYITGHLFSEQRRFGFQATFFRSALHPPPAQDNPTNFFGRDHVYLAHMALVDVAGKNYHSEERLNRNGWDAFASTTNLSLRNGNWTLSQASSGAEKAPIQLQASVLGRALLELDLVPAKPLVVFGENGVSRKGADPSAASYYLTFPRLDTRGTLVLDGKTNAVTGQSWMDHEISSSQLTTNQVGWDWVSIQFTDGREIMLYVMRTRAGGIDPHSTLAWVDESGGLVQVGPTDFSWHPRRHWRSRRTGANYPVEAILETADPKSKRRLSLRVKPVLDDQEMVGKLAGISYWEGACDVLNEEGKSLGVAYLELTGYADDLSRALSK